MFGELNYRPDNAEQTFFRCYCENVCSTDTCCQCFELGFIFMFSFLVILFGVFVVIILNVFLGRTLFSVIVESFCLVSDLKPINKQCTVLNVF